MTKVPLTVGTEDPVVSVIIPTFNRATTLERAIRSVLAQTNQRFKIIVMDDHSTDDTEQLSHRIVDRRIEWHRQEKNIGVGKNWADGLRRVQTKYYCLLMDDDYYGPNFLAARISALDKFPSSGVAFSAYQSVDEAGNSLGISRQYPYPSLTELDPLEACRVTQAGGTFVGAMMFRQAVSAPLWSLSEKYELIFDGALLMWLFLKAHAKAVFVDDTSFCNTAHPGQLFHTRRLAVYEKVSALLRDASKEARTPPWKSLLRDSRGQLLDDWAKFLAPRSPGEALSKLVLSLWHDPFARNRLRQKLYTVALALKLKPDPNLSPTASEP